MEEKAAEFGRRYTEHIWSGGEWTFGGARTLTLIRYPEAYRYTGVRTSRQPSIYPGRCQEVGKKARLPISQARPFEHFT